MKNATCHICGYQNEIPDGQACLCALCGTDLATPKLEITLLEDTRSATFATADNMKTLGMEAHIYLTDKRLIIIPTKLQGLGLTGLLTAVVCNNMASGLSLFSIPYENMKSVRDGKFGLLVKALIVDTTDGELVKIKVSKRDEWKEAITKAIHALR